MGLLHTNTKTETDTAQGTGTGTDTYAYIASHFERTRRLASTRASCVHTALAQT